MTKHRLQQELNVELESEFVEMDPTGRYGRYKEVLGKGASKIVYRAFDEIEGIEVAWNQVKVKDVLQTPEDLERLYSEVHLLKTLKHKNIIKFYSSWVDTKTKNINFVTEMFTSGNLRQYRQRHKHVDIRAVKNWSRQILRGLLYLHSHDPPIIHRDLKCDNIFVNGNQGEVKIGDLGLAAILRKSHAAHTIIGTPEFMAPELYEEEYNELVDIYAFGMCLLEMLTFEYPYSECSNPAQIYKKVISGRKPAALYRVKDPEVRQFVEKCLATVSRRLPARELLMDPFLQSEGRSSEYSFPTLGIYKDDMAELGPFVLEPRIEVSKHGGHNAHRNMQTAHLSRENGTFDRYEAGEHYKVVPSSLCFKEDALSKNRDFTVKGKKRDDDTIFLRLRIADKEGHVRNIYFPFDVEGDTALSVASEMVTELDITDQDVTKIADMIDEEILALVPDWKAGVDVEDCHTFPNHNHFISNTTENCCSNYNVLHHMSAISSNSSLLEYLKSHNCGTEVAPCTRVECAAVHGRFEEVTYKVDETDFSSYVAEEAPTISSESSDVLFHDADDWINEEDPVSPRLNILHASGTGNSDKSESCSVSSVVGNKEGVDRNKPAEPIGNMGLVDETWRHGFPERFNPFHEEDCFSSVPKSELYLSLPSTFDTLSDEDEDSVIRELRLLTANHQEELKELQRKHEVALLEIQNRWRKRKDLRPFPGMPKFSPEAKSQEWKMSLNGWQEHQKDGCNRHCRAARDTLKCENNEFESVTMNRLVPDAGRMGISESDSSRSSPRNPAVSPDRHPVSRQAMTCSPPPKPDNKTSPSNRRLMKMHSFGDVDGHLCMRSLAVEVGRLQHEQTIGAFRTENLNATKDCHGALRCASSIPGTSSPRNYVEGRAQRNLHQPEYFV